MPRKKKKKNLREPKILKNGRIIPTYVLKARSLRKSLLQRVSNPELKSNTATIKQLEKLLNHEHFICFYCLKELTLDEISCDHKTPLSRLGTNEISNLCLCCMDCNGVKAEFTEEEFRNLMEFLKTWEDKGKYLFTRLRRGGMIFGRK